jgi:hypothetical protein
MFGYYFKILAAPAPYSHGLQLNYRGNRPPSEGVALIAWPAAYGIDGFRTFVINHLGDLYQRDFGNDTARTAEAMTAFIPDRSWSKVGGE